MRSWERSPDLDNPARPPVDASRALGAIALVVEPVGPAEFRLDGRDGESYVALAPYFECDCGDFIFRGQICKHLTAALLHIGDARTLAETSAAVDGAVRAEPTRKAAGAKRERTPPSRRPKPGPQDDAGAPDDGPLEIGRVELGNWWQGHGTDSRHAAGEDIERPAAAVKEFIENALNAGAGRVDVHLDDGGLTSIRVADDGCGMDPEDDVSRPPCTPPARPCPTRTSSGSARSVSAVRRSRRLRRSAAS